jgi:hypothetical protein
MKLLPSQFLAILAGLVCSLILTACKPATPEEGRLSFNEKWGPEVTFVDNHLMVDWPDYTIGAAQGARTRLRIPAAYLHGQFLLPDEKGKAHRIYLELMLPDGKAFPKVKLPWNATEEQIRQDKELVKKRLFVTMQREGRYDPARNRFEKNGYLRLTLGDKAFLDGEVDGLEKYSRPICMEDNLTAPEAFKIDLQQKIAQKTPTDRAPAGCVTSDYQFILISPQNETSQYEFSRIRCNRDGICDADFNVAGRNASTHIAEYQGAHVGEWRTRVRTAQRVIEGFVVPPDAKSP